jgi:hypothetical protein
MSVYTFYLRSPGGASQSFEAYELATDGEALRQADAVLARHLSADCVEVWAEDRAVAARHREQPVIRPITLLDA